MANKPTQPVFPLGLVAEEQSTLAGVLNTGTIEHGPDAVLTLPEGNASAGLPSSVRYNADSDEFEGFYGNGGWLPLGGGGIRWEVLPHASTATLTEGRGYLINNTTGASTVVFPSPTRIGDSVTICDAYGKFATYPLTVSPSGNNLYGSTEDMAITTDNVSATFTWSGPEQGWIITSGVGLGQGRVYSREIFTKILASETSSIALNTPPTIVDVYADGKRLAESKYSLDGNVITFSPSLSANTELQVIEYTPIQLGNGGGSGSSTITWVYNGGSAIGGETEITLDVVVDDVPAIDINGSRQYKNLGFTFDPLTSKITLAQELEPEDEVVVIINGTPNIYNQIDRSLQEVARAANVKNSEVILSTDTTQFLNDKKVVYSVSEQKAYGLPALPTNVYISSVSDGQLTYNPGSITVDLIPLPNSVELLSNNLMSSTGASFVKHGGKTVGEILDTLSSVQLHYSSFASLTELHDYIINNNLTNVDIIFDKVLTLGPGSGGLGTLFVLSNMKHLGVHNLVIDDTLLYSGSFDLTRVFDLTNIGNLYMEVDATSTLEYVGDDKRGLTPLRLNGCDNFTFIGKTTRCYQGYECTNVKNLHARSVNNDTRYPHLLGNVGTVDIHTVNNGCRRDFFLTNNCAGGKITVDAVDTQQGTPIKMYFYNGNMDNQISNLTINYKYRSTGRYTLPYRVAPIWLDWGWDSTITESMIAGLMRNITINYDVVGGNWGSVIGTTKLIDESVADNNPRGYGYSNIVITGRIELGGGDSNNHAWFFNFNSNDNWVSGDTINGFICRDLVVRKLNGGDVYVNTNQLTGAVANYGGVKFEGVSAPEAKLTATDYSKVKFANCTFSDFASLGAATDSSKCATGSLLFIKAAGNPGKFKLGTVSTYRNVSLWTVDIVANSPLSGVSSAWHGRLQGTLAMATTPAASTMEGSVQSSFTKGTAATPTISVDASGNVFLNFDGWDALEANVAVNVKMQYDEYSGGGNKTVRGMLSKANGGFSLNLS